VSIWGIVALSVVLRFSAAGTDGSTPPPARRYVVKQSRRPIRSARAFDRAHALCGGRCSFSVTTVGGPAELRITRLRRHTVYHYAVRALDNVSGRPGPRSKSVRVRTR